MYGTYEQVNEASGQYWSRVQNTLIEVFNWDLQQSDVRIREAILDLEQQEPEAQVVFYHAEPYDVAEDFARERYGDEVIGDRERAIPEQYLRSSS